MSKGFKNLSWSAWPNAAHDIIWLCLIGLIAFLPGLASLPVIDRDEARYVQATVQMIETDDFIDIRFQEQARHKKPAGAYWAQVGAIILTGQVDDVQRGERSILVHRLPSLIGALIAVIATYLTGAALFGRREGLVGAAMLAVSVSLVFEAHQAKTDAMLAGACAVALYGVMTRRPWPTWLAIAAGVLLKGPVIIGVVFLAMLVSGMATRSAAHAKALLRPLPILAACLIAAPWFIAIGLQTDGAFFTEALFNDFGGKIASTQETHGGPPGYYGLTSLIMLWPAILAVPLACVFAWRNRRDAAVIALLAWIVPMWVILEFVPTKLPHYTLPLYPAIAVLIGAALIRASMSKRAKTIGLILAAIAGIILAIVLLLTVIEQLGTFGVILLTAWLLALVGAILWTAHRQHYMASAIIGAVFMATGFGGILPRSAQFDLTPRLIAGLQTDARIVSTDYHEPSLVFLAGTDTGLSRSALRAGDVLITATDTPAPACALANETVSGMNYAKGRELALTIYTTDQCSAAEITVWAQTGS